MIGTVRSDGRPCTPWHDAHSCVLVSMAVANATPVLNENATTAAKNCAAELFTILLHCLLVDQTARQTRLVDRPSRRDEGRRGAVEVREQLLQFRKLRQVVGRDVGVARVQGQI